jgi:hypothetical protein
VKCTCVTDLVCSSVGNTCASGSALVACAQDAQACFYQSSSSPCTDGACSGDPGTASCCTNACASGPPQCTAITSIQSCAAASNGCNVTSTSTCSTGLVCERYGMATCVDPNWAEWPMPNGPADSAAGAPNPESYTDNRDGTVTDNVTGLIWQQALPSGTYAWADAVTYCSTTLTLAGHHDWRLPSMIELVSIVDYGQSSPSINATYFPNTPATSFWSSTPSPASAAAPFDVTFLDGSTNGHNSSTAENVRCVR